MVFNYNYVRVKIDRDYEWKQNGGITFFVNYSVDIVQ